jgi:hypothetical protein
MHKPPRCLSLSFFLSLSLSLSLSACARARVSCDCDVYNCIILRIRQHTPATLARTVRATVTPTTRFIDHKSPSTRSQIAAAEGECDFLEASLLARIIRKHLFYLSLQLRINIRQNTSAYVTHIPHVALIHARALAHAHAHARTRTRVHTHLNRCWKEVGLELVGIACSCFKKQSYGQHALANVEF